MVPGVPWFVPHHPTSASIFTRPPLQSQISLCLTLTRTLVIGFRVHPDNPGRSHLETRNLMTSAKTLFPGKVPFTVLGGCILQGPLLDALQSHLVDDSPHAAPVGASSTLHGPHRFPPAPPACAGSPIPRAVTLLSGPLLVTRSVHSLPTTSPHCPQPGCLTQRCDPRQPSCEGRGHFIPRSRTCTPGALAFPSEGEQS